MSDTQLPEVAVYAIAGGLCAATITELRGAPEAANNLGECVRTEVVVAHTPEALDTRTRAALISEFGLSQAQAQEVVPIMLGEGAAVVTLSAFWYASLTPGALPADGGLHILALEQMGSYGNGALVTDLADGMAVNQPSIVQVTVWAPLQAPPRAPPNSSPSVLAVQLDKTPDLPDTVLTGGVTQITSQCTTVSYDVYLNASEIIRVVYYDDAGNDLVLASGGTVTVVVTAL